MDTSTLHNHLSRLFSKEQLFTDKLSRLTRGTDAGLYRLIPKAVVKVKNEEEAMIMYSNLAEACLDDEEKDLFLGLEEMERMHKVRLEKLFLETGYAEVW